MKIKLSNQHIQNTKLIMEIKKYRMSLGKILKIKLIEEKLYKRN